MANTNKSTSGIGSDDVVIKRPPKVRPDFDVIFARFKEAYRKIASKDGEWAAHNVWQYIVIDTALNGGDFEQAVKTLEAISK